MPVCTIHMGLPKAGSTSIQGAILANRAKLADRGIFVPETTTAGYHTAHHTLARAFLNLSKDPSAQGLVDGLKDELASAGFPPHVLLSSEDFQMGLRRPGYVARLREFFAGLGYTLRLVAYVRPQVSYINSCYSQDCKVFGETLDIEAYVARALELKRFNYRWLLLPALESERIEIIYRPFNDDVLNTGIASDFFAVIGLDAAAIADLRMPEARNVSPGPKVVAACREIALRLSQNGIVLDQSGRARASKAIARLGEHNGWQSTRYSGLTDKMARQIRKRFAKGNAIFAEKAWNRGWKDVFGADWWLPRPLNVFDRDQAPAEEVKAFDQVVERAWQLLRDGKLDALVAEADLAATSTPLERWLTQLRASSAGLRTKLYTGTSTARRD